MRVIYLVKNMERDSFEINLIAIYKSNEFKTDLEIIFEKFITILLSYEYYCYNYCVTSIRNTMTHKYS